MIGQDKPYPELPYSWTIARHGYPTRKDRFFGLNRHTGQETIDFKSYGEALREVERLELQAKAKELHGCNKS